ncbi:unnamed protein product [Calypogeia fissa]
MALPPGFRFHPTDEELVAYYLKRKVAGRTIEYNFIPEIDLYKQEPWDLPEKSFLPGSDMEWYFFSPRDKKYPNGLRTNRATEAGYWKATGKDRNVKKGGRTVVGMKKTLVFYRGRAPHGERTDWVMHEYRLDEEECEKVHASQDLFVLCRVFKKSGVGPRSGEDRGPQTYVDEDIDKEPSGSFADAVKRALEPEPTLTVPTPEIPAQETAPTESPEVARVENTSVLAPTLSVDDYEPGEGAGDASDMPSVQEYLLEEPSLPALGQSEDGQFWDCLTSITGLDLPCGAAESSTQEFSSSSFLEAWQGDRETNSGMMWTSDLSSSVSQPQYLQEAPNGGAGYLDMLQMELLESDDVLPPLVEELESNKPSNQSEGSGVVPNFGENENQQLRGRGLARARSRAARQQPTSEEAQQRARGSNDGLYRPEATPQQRMSNTNFRSPEVVSQAREGSTSSYVMWSGPGGSSATNFDTSQLPSSSDPAASASASGSRISGVPSSEESLFSFQDSLQDFPLDDELYNWASEYDESDFSPAGPPQSVGDQGNTEVTRPPSDKPMKQVQSAVSEGPPGSSSSTSEVPSEEGKPLSKPLVGLLKLLGSLPALPASAAECAPDMKPLHTNGGVSSTYSSILVSAVTVTCTSSADGAQKVQTAVTDCRLQGDAKGVYQQVVSGSLQSEGSDMLKPLCANCDTAAGSVDLQRRVARGSNSGFVFVFVLGAVSALCWFLLIRLTWRLARHVFTSVF